MIELYEPVGIAANHREPAVLVAARTFLLAAAPLVGAYVGQFGCLFVCLSVCLSVCQQISAEVSWPESMKGPGCY